MFSRYSNGFKQMKIISTQSNPVQILTLSIGRLNTSKKAAGIQDGNYLSADSRHEVGRCNGGRWRWLYDSTCLLNLGKYKKRKTRSMIAGRIAPLACGYWLMKHQVRAVVMRMELTFSIPYPPLPEHFYYNYFISLFFICYTSSCEMDTVNQLDQMKCFLRLRMSRIAHRWCMSH